METELCLIKLENRRREKRITWEYIIQCTTENLKVTSLLKFKKLYLEQKL